MDIVRDILDRISSACQAQGGFTEDLLLQIETQVRADWGGDRPYITKAGEVERLELSARNASILRDWRNGERVPFIARKYGLSRVRVWNIVRESR